MYIGCRVSADTGVDKITPGYTRFHREMAGKGSGAGDMKTGSVAGPLSLLSLFLFCLLIALFVKALLVAGTVSWT